MATCYVSNYMPIPSIRRSIVHHSPVAADTPITPTANATPVPFVVPPPAPSTTVCANPDYSKPLHVDCSIEYELPNQAKPPVGVRNEPLLMIHPSYFRKIESQKRSPFVNNLPPSLNLSTTSSSTNVNNTTTSTSRLQQPVTLAVTNNTASQINKKRLLQQQQQQQYKLQPQPQPQYSVQWDSEIPSSTAVLPSTIIQNSNNSNKYMVRNSCCNNNSNSNQWVQQTTTMLDTSSPAVTDKESSYAYSTGKYSRQYSRSNVYHDSHHRLHPYIYSTIPIASTFPQMQQVCYNV